MVDVTEARKLAEENAIAGLHVSGRPPLSDGRYYIFGYEEKADISPIGVDRETGDVIMYFPPDHLPEFLSAAEVKE